MAAFRFSDFFDTTFQQQILARLLKDESFLIRAYSILKSQYFSVEIYSDLCDAIFEYFVDYTKLPPPESLRTLFLQKARGEATRVQYANFLESLYKLEEFDEDFLEDQLVTFCQRAEAAVAVTTAAHNLRDFSIEETTKKLDTVLQLPALFSDLGLSLKDDYRVIFEEDTTPIYPTGYTGLDQCLRGGGRGGELICFMAPTKVGKSLILNNVGCGHLLMGELVAIYSLEMYCADYMKRTIGNLVQRPTNNLKDYGQDIVELIEQLHIISPGNIIFKEFPARETPLALIEAHMNMLKAKYGRYPIPIIDYADLLKWTGKEEWQGLSNIYIDMRNLARRCNVPIYTASQTNASGFHAEELGAEHQSGSTRKGFQVDVMFGVQQDKLDYACNRFQMTPFLNRHARKDQTTFWTVSYEQGWMREVDAETYFSIAPPDNYLDQREARKIVRGQFEKEQKERTKNHLLEQLNKMHKIAPDGNKR